MKRFAWLLGVLGGFALVSFGVYAAFVDKVAAPWAVVGGVGAALVIAWLALARDEISRYASARGTRYSTTALVTVLIGGGIVVALNILANRYDKRWDVSASQRYALSDQTKKIVRGLDKDVRVMAFFTSGSQEESKFKALVEGYQQLSDHIEVEFHDPVREPMLAQKEGITSQYGTVLLSSGDDKQRIDSEFDEQSLTNALVKLTSGVEHEVCFTDGHGELDPDDTMTASGLGGVITRLKGQNYKVKKITLLRTGGVPEDCDLLVVAAPQVDWLPAEREMLAAWLASGHPAEVMLEPTLAQGLAHDLLRYGVKVGDDVVLEQNPNYQLVGGDISYIILDRSSFAPSDFTEPIKGMAILRMARSVGTGPAVDGIQVQELAHTSQYGWAETNLDSRTAPKPDPDQDTVGDVPLMAVADIKDPKAIEVGSRKLAPGGDAALTTVSADPPKADAGGNPSTGSTDAGATEADSAFTPKAGGKLLVVGDSDFASNALVDQGSNADLFLNSISWLAGEKDQISIRTNPASKASLSMNLVQGIVVWLICLLIVPGLAVAGAIGTWRYRRSL